MPFPSSSSAPPGPRRRSLLASAAGAVLLTGCAGGSGAPGSALPSAAERVRARAARDSEGLAARYGAVIAAHPGLAARLRPLRDEVERHAAAFGAFPAASASPSPPPSPSVSARAAGPTGDPGDDPAAVPAAEKDSLAGLVRDERELADRRTGALDGLPGELARLMASVAAAGAAHVYLLTKGTAA
ncbi:hypothetical protein [Streptomyces sp. SID8352]|uniref:hypothetical protein n=1 Tax=Streptomyces sp. SID8352 TaxID=2690338 RepID=UPI00136A063B|nr:hypothetical protein [Streptomyces sp. SID8352]